MQEDYIPLEEIRECLDRSGYLLESRLVRSLTHQGYFVEPNQVVRDPRTGKSREIDLVAEDTRYLSNQGKVFVKTHFVVEAINNRFPFVLTTARPSTPNADFESYVQFICTPEPNPFIDSLELLDVFEEKGVNWDNLFSQYCVLSRKNNNKELMASHSDDVYSSLVKLSEYVESDLNYWHSRDEVKNDGRWRLYFWNPMLVLSGQLVSIRLHEDGTPELQETHFGRIEFNWHTDAERRTTIIEIVTEKYFLERLEMIISKDEELEGKINAIRQELLL